MMLASVCCFAAMQAWVKDLREHGMSTLEVMVWRSAPGMPLVWLEMRVRGVPLRARRPRVVAIRTALGCGAMATNFWAVQTLALVQHAVVHLTQPVFVALTSPRLLRERSSPRVIVALIVAIVGAVTVLLPPDIAQAGGAVVGVAMPLVPGIVGLCSAGFSALAHVTLRMATSAEIAGSLDRNAPPDDPSTVVFHFTLVVTVVGIVLGVALGDFRELPVGLSLRETATRIAAMATAGLLGQLAMSGAYSRAPAPSVAIVGYAVIPISAVIDVSMWGAPLGWPTLAGASIMACAGWLLVRAARA